MANLISVLTGMIMNEMPDPRGSACGLIQIPSHRGSLGNVNEPAGETIMAQALDPSEIVEFKRALVIR